jgi:hypothetical protein
MKIKLKYKLFIAYFIVIAIFAISIFLVVSSQVKKLADNNILYKVVSDSKLGYSLANTKYPGDWSVKAGQLFKGKNLINGTNDLTDEVSLQTGSLAAIFLGSTNISDSGADKISSPNNKLTADSEIVKTVLDGGKAAIKNVYVGEKLYKVRYMPLADSTGKTVGIWAVGIDSNRYVKQNNQFGNIYMTIIIFIFILILVGVAVALFRSTFITNPINSVIKKLNKDTQLIDTTSDYLLSSSRHLAEANSQLAESIAETSATLKQSAEMIEQNSTSTRHAALLAAQTKVASDKGNNEMENMMRSMSEIKKSSDQIKKIIKVIDEIAFQTNILALNAAVEAARAGDAGMGFAVVAEEVRNLAQRSAQAASDTAIMIEGNIELSETGVSVAKRVGESLTEITLQANKVKELMEEIDAAGQEQSQGILQINKAIGQMQKATHQNEAISEESAGASEELGEQVESLKNVIYQLAELINGDKIKENPYDPDSIAINRNQHTKPQISDRRKTTRYLK